MKRSILISVVVTVVFALLLVACSDNGSPAAKPATTRPTVASDADPSVSKGPEQVSRIQGPRATPQELEVAKAKKGSAARSGDRLG